MAQQLFSPANAFIQGRDARQQYDAGQTRNALAQMELDNAPREIANRNALMDMQREAQRQALSREQAEFAYARLRQAADSGNPKAFVLQYIPDLASKLGQQGVDLQSMDDQSAAQLVDDLARKYAGDAGIAPTPKPEIPQIQQTPGPSGSTIVTRGNQMQVVQSPKPEKPDAPKDERLVQIADAQGNPKWVRESDAVGQPAYVARDKPAAADLKFQREIKAKIPRLNAALRRMDRVDQAVEGISKGWLTDGGELDQYIINRTPEGQELVAASAQLLPELTALTRVPGIGSQSDLESRLASLQFPSSEFPPDVNRRNAAELRAFLDDLKDAYASVDGGGQEAGNQPPAAPAMSQRAPGQAPAAAVEYLRKNPQFKGAFRQKYGYLPPGM